MKETKTALFTRSKLINPPQWVLDSKHVIYEVYTGSQAYGIANENSDWDIYSVVVPPKEIVFPHLGGYIPGFDRDIPDFTTYEPKNKITYQNRDYDIKIHSIIKFFDMAAENNPNIVDTLYVPDNCILYIAEGGKIIRENRKKFLHKGSLWKFIGYAYSQLNLLDKPRENSHRKAMIDTFGLDLKAASHLVRLLNECWMILETGDLDLCANTGMLKEIRRGEWTQQQVRDYFKAQEPMLKELYTRSKLQDKPNRNDLKKILISVLETVYGSLYCAECALKYETVTNNQNHELIQKIKELLK
jgi:predicted nucleotidyltransferase